MSEPVRILYVDDYPLDRELVRDALEKETDGFQVTEADSRAEFEAQLATSVFDLVLSDFNILGFEGLQVLDAVHAKAPTVPVVIVTGTGTEEVAVEAMKRGAADYVIKTPQHIQRLPQTIRAAIEKQQLQNEYARTLELLAEEHNLLRTLIDTVPESICVKDTEGRYVLNNNAHARLLGAAAPGEVVGKTDFDYFPHELAAQQAAEEQEILRSGQAQINQEQAIADQSGDQRWFLTTKVSLRNRQGRLVGLVGVSRDITQRKRLEAQFLQAQKMESIGQLAGGVAHDFNNLLTIITGYADMAMEELPPGSAARADLLEIQKAVGRATYLIRQLLAFARRPISEPRTLSLNDLIVDLEKTLRRLINEDIDLVTRLTPRLGHIKADPGQIEQVLVNLVINARDAMPGGGKLTLETRDVSGVGASTDRYVLLTISDTGVGMDAQVRQRIFEPFFTTKQQGHGTGLGLTTCYGIVAQHGGLIEVASAPGQGTTFNVYLPHVEAVAETPSQHDDTGDLPRGTETVLLVEDDLTIRELVARVLRAQGYTVLEATNGKEAVQVAQEYAGPTIDLLLADVVMPQMGGKILAEQLKARSPGIKVLLISGYTSDTVVHPGSLPDSSFLQKPFSPTALARKVREVLGD